MSIEILNDPSGTVRYTDRYGTVIELNKFNAEYDFVIERSSAIDGAARTNLSARNNYEQQVKNLQESIDTGRDTLSNATTKLPTAPHCLHYPEDFVLPPSTVDWEPPLLTLKESQSGRPAPNQAGGIGPNSPVRQNAVTVEASNPEHLANALQIVSKVGPMLPEFIALLQALLSHHTANTANTAQ